MTLSNKGDHHLSGQEGVVLRMWLRDNAVGGKGLKEGGGGNKKDRMNKFPSSIFMLCLIYIFFLLPIKADREHKDGDTRRAPKVRGQQLTCQKQSTD